MALAMPVVMPKQSARFAAQLNSPPLTWIWHSVALRNGMIPGSKRWIKAPSESKSSAPAVGISRVSVMILVGQVGNLQADCQSASSCLRVVSPRRNPAAAPSPVSMEELAARLIDALISVRAEEIALGLQ